jgi:hypothetical protein
VSDKIIEQRPAFIGLLVSGVDQGAIDISYYHHSVTRNRASAPEFLPVRLVVNHGFYHIYD